MSKLENSIGWCDDTGNKVIGCDPLSPGCKNCYAKEFWERKGVNFVKDRIPVAGFSAKLRRLNKLCICDKCHETQPFARVGQECGLCPPGSILADDECTGTLRRIRFFADSNSDFLDRKWPLETFAEFIGEICKAENLDVLLVTKRINQLADRMTEVAKGGFPCTGETMLRLVANAEWPDHIWLGVSVENQEMADKRRPFLERIQAAVRFVSYEPALEPVNWQGWEFLDWMIAGLESGTGRRDGGLGCLSGAAVYCATHQIPIYIKQDCAFKSGQQGRIPLELWNQKHFPRQAAAGQNSQPGGSR